MNASHPHPLPDTLATLAQAPRWVAWQTEEREAGKPKTKTKVPYNPGSTTGKAFANDPATWGTRAAAAARAAKLPKPFGLGGVGIEFGDLGDGRHILGVDLDTCRDAAGALTPWAGEVVDGFGTYTEISPSGTGVKVFATVPATDLPAIRAAMGTEHGKQFKRTGGEHPPAIELHVSSRYFAVTDDHLAGTPLEVRLVALPTLLWLIREAGPTFIAAGQPLSEANGAVADGHDQSRSAIAFRKGVALCRGGSSYDEMVASLAADPKTEHWVTDKGHADKDRELRRIWKAGEAHNTDRGLPDRKRPLFRPLPPAPAFPTQALGKLRDAAEAIQARTQAPAAICAQSVLAAATLAVQAHRDVELPGSGRRPLTGLFASVAESGERKTSVDGLALAAVRRIEERWRQDGAAELTAFNNDHDAWKSARETAKKSHKGNRSAIRDALDKLGTEPKPPPPPPPLLLVEDLSSEALILHLRDARPWGGVFTSEGGALVGGHAFNDEKAMATGALLNTLWDGNPIRRIRVLTGRAYLPGRRCSAHIMMQRVVADKLLGDPVLNGIGTTARLLIVEPESTIGARLFREPWAECAPVLDDYNDRLTALLTREPVTASNAPDVLTPPPMILSVEARAMWVAFHDAVEADLGAGRPLHSICAFGSKLAEHAGRLAAVLCVYADPECMEVDGETMACGIVLAQHYAAEMLRLYGGAAISLDLRLADRLLTWWQARTDPQCHLAAIYQTGPSAVRDAEAARRIVAILVGHGWIDRLPPGTVIDGSPRRDAWILAP